MYHPVAMLHPAAPPRPSLAVLYQASKPPIRNGLAKPMKPGGYSDSGADIAFSLAAAGVPVITPAADPDPLRNLDWVFPDTASGIEHALSLGASILWANTTLFAGHPLESVSALFVGQSPSGMETFDDKFATNRLLHLNGIPVARSILIGVDPDLCDLPLDQLTLSRLSSLGLDLPLMLKPVRGRGSQGVVLVHTLEQLQQTALQLLQATESIDGSSFPLYGATLILEQYLSGEEITLTIMPPGAYRLPSGPQTFDRPWALPPIHRFHHANGVLPYNGVVPVSSNSLPLRITPEIAASIQAVEEACIRAAELVGLKAPIRIDCRQESSLPHAGYLLFDLNMKPNLTGAGRPGREAQDCLSAIAARALGWRYTDLLQNMLAQAWSPTLSSSSQPHPPPPQPRP